jgi:hypothetical protein
MTMCPGIISTRGGLGITAMTGAPEGTSMAGDLTTLGGAITVAGDIITQGGGVPPPGGDITANGITTGAGVIPLGEVTAVIGTGASQPVIAPEARGNTGLAGMRLRKTARTGRSGRPSAWTRAAWVFLKCGNRWPPPVPRQQPGDKMAAHTAVDTTWAMPYSAPCWLTVVPSQNEGTRPAHMAELADALL